MNSSWRLILQENKLAILTLLVVIPFLAAATHIYEQKMRAQMFAWGENELQSDLELRHTLLTNQILDYQQKLQFLYFTPPIKGIIRATQNNGTDPYDQTSNVQWKIRLSTIFEAFLATNPNIMQVRYIGISDKGLELVRVEKQFGKIIISSKASLQEKADSEYFKDIIKLNEGDIYVSKIELNRESGKIETPHWPTLRMATPIFDELHNLFGFLIINIDANNLIQQLKENTGENRLFFITNDQGFIAHPQSDKQFAYEFDQNVNWQSEFTDIAPLNNKSTLKSFVKLDNNDTYIAQNKNLNLFPGSDATNLNLIMAAPTNSLEEAIIERRISFVAFSVIVSGVLLFFILLYQRSLKRKLSMLKSKAEFEAIVNSSSEGIISINTTGIVTSWNPAAEVIFGIPSYSAVSKPVFEIVKFSDSPSLFNEQTLNDICHKKAIPTFDNKIVKNSGEEVFLSITFSPIQLANGDIPGATIIVHDITERKQIEHKLISMNASLENQVKERTRDLEAAKNKALEASDIKSDFIANVSHEIRTPMNGVIGMLNLLKKESLSENQNRYVNMAASSANALTKLITDVLDLSKIEADKLELESINVDLFELFREISCTMSIAALEKGIELNLDLSQLLHTHVISDPNRIRQILINLIGNAIKFTSTGAVTLRVTNELKSKKLIELTCQVIDTGIGISEDKQAKIFDSYTQAGADTERRFGGTGLGLAISKKLSELLGGSIALESKINKGTTISVHLNVEVANTNTSVTVPNLQNHTVLVLSRSEAAAQVITNHCTAANTTCKVCTSPDDLMQIANSGDINNPIILFDCPARTKNQEKCKEVFNQNNLVNATKIVILPFNVNEAPDIPNDYKVLTKPYTAKDLYNLLQPSNDANNLAQPSSTEKLEQLPQSEIQALLKQYSGKKILLVDDNRVNQVVAEGILDECGLEADLANDGLEALTQLQNSDTVNAPYALILMDCQMPELDGYDTTQLIRQGKAGDCYVDIPIIAMTANAMAGSKERCLNAGMNDYITKPIEPDEVEEKLLFWLQLAQDKSKTTTKNAISK